MNLKQVFNYLFIFSMVILPTFGLIKFNEYMDYYEMFILAATGITFILINKYWQNFSYLVSTILM